MTVYILLLIPTAFFAYMFGGLDTMVLASNFVFRRGLWKLGRGNVWLSNFRRIYGVGGFVKLLLVELVKDLIPIFIGGILLGMSRTTAAEFTFFLAVPVMAGASLLKLVKFGLAFSASEAVILIVGMVVAFVVSIIVIKFLLNYIRRNDFKAFGWYRIVLGVLVILFFSL